MSNDNKKDLTRIEDLGEFLHELNDETESFEIEKDIQGLGDLPEVPSEFEVNAFEEESPPLFGEEEPLFETNTEEIDNEPFALSEEEEVQADFSSDFASATEEPSFDASSDEDLFGNQEIETPLETEQEPETDWNTPLQEEEEAAPASNYFSAPQEETFKEHKSENFEDIKKFAESSTYSSTTAEANPSFSILIKNVQFIEDAQDMATLLNELKVIESVEDAKKSLARGSLLIPRISEFAAVFIAHKLRRFDADILVGLSDDIHPPKYKDESELGLVSKQHLYQNQAHAFDFSRPKIDLSSIIISTSPQLDQYQVLRYVGVASEHAILDASLVEDESSAKIQLYYEELAHKLKAHAVKQNANAVIGINYHLTPLPQEFSTGSARYKLACTGNLVWVNRL